MTFEKQPFWRWLECSRILIQQHGRTRVMCFQVMIVCNLEGTCRIDAVRSNGSPSQVIQLRATLIQSCSLMTSVNLASRIQLSFLKCQRCYCTTGTRLLAGSMLISQQGEQTVVFIHPQDAPLSPHSGRRSCQLLDHRQRLHRCIFKAGSPPNQTC